MTMRVIPFPIRRSDRYRISGFEIGHESASGNSWGSFSGPNPTGQTAITAAYALNRDVYEGGCDVLVCDAAVQDGSPHVALPSLPGDF